MNITNINEIREKLRTERILNSDFGKLYQAVFEKIGHGSNYSKEEQQTIMMVMTAWSQTLDGNEYEVYYVG